MSLDKAAEAVARYSFLGGEAFLLSELVSDHMPNHLSSHDERSMRVIALNAMWNMFSDFLTSVRSFVPNTHELLVNPHLIILENISNASNRSIILKLKEEFQRSTDNSETDRFISLIYSKLPAWKLMVIALDLKRRATPGVTAQRAILILLETLSELTYHTKVCIIPNRRFHTNSDGVQYLTFRAQLFEKKQILTRARGQRNFQLEQFSSALSPDGNIFLVTGINGYPGSPCWNDLPLYGESQTNDQGIEILRSFTTDLRWASNIQNPIVYNSSSSPIDVHIRPVLVKIPEGYILTFTRMNTNVSWATEALAEKAVPGIYRTRINEKLKIICRTSAGIVGACCSRTTIGGPFTRKDKKINVVT